MGWLAMGWLAREGGLGRGSAREGGRGRAGEEGRRAMWSSSPKLSSWPSRMVSALTWGKWRPDASSSIKAWKAQLTRARKKDMAQSGCSQTTQRNHGLRVSSSSGSGKASLRAGDASLRAGLRSRSEHSEHHVRYEQIEHG